MNIPKEQSMSKFKVGDKVQIVRKWSQEGGTIGIKFIIGEIQGSRLISTSKTYTGWLYHSAEACKLCKSKIKLY